MNIKQKISGQDKSLLVFIQYLYYSSLHFLLTYLAGKKCFIKTEISELQYSTNSKIWVITVQEIIQLNART